MSPFFTATGTFEWLYSAVVLSPEINFAKSTTGNLLLLSSTPFILVIDFLKTKSTSFSFGKDTEACNSIGNVLFSTSTTGCSFKYVFALVV